MMHITVIIATYNRALTLKKCLESLASLKIENFSVDFIVIDNNSTDNTKEIVNSFHSKLAGQITYLFEQHKGKTTALNTAINHAKGDILAFTDDDVIVTPDWLLKISQCLEINQCDGVGGRILPNYPLKTPNWIKANADLLVGPIIMYDYGEDTKIFKKPMYEFLGANFAFKRTVFKDCGMFRTDIGPGKGKFGDDTELINRFLKAGKKLYYCGSATVWHPVENNRMSLFYIGKWFYGLGKYRIIVDQQGHPKNVASFFNVPRYLIRRILINAGLLFLNIFNQRNFLKSYIEIFIDLGRASELKRLIKKS